LQNKKNKINQQNTEQLVILAQLLKLLTAIAKLAINTTLESTNSVDIIMHSRR